MQPSIHYYVLSLSENMSRLYEGFRDKLIDIDDGKFPQKRAPVNNPDTNASKVEDFCRLTDQHFAHYFKQDPLRLVLIGERSTLAMFEALKMRQDILIGTVPGDYGATSIHDLGKIVWPVVKQAIAGMKKNTMRELAMAFRINKIVAGIDAVSLAVETESGSTLYVEEDYHVKGSIHKTDQSFMISKHIDISQVIDDVVDIIIEKALQTGGRVIFLDNGSLTQFGRIVLIRS